MMDNGLAIVIIRNYKYDMMHEFDRHYSYLERKRVQDAIQYCIDKLERESAYYCNLPKGDDHNEIR